MLQSNCKKEDFNYSINRFILFFIAINPIFDYLYTIFSTYFNLYFSVNQLLRGFIIVYMISIVKYKKSWYYIIAMLLFCVIDILLIWKFDISKDILKDIFFVLKFLNFFIYFIVIKELLLRKKIKLMDLFKSLRVLSIISSIGVLLGKVGLGMTTYSAFQDSSRGLFGSGNLVICTLGMTTPIIYYLYKKQNNIIDAIIYFLNCFAMLYVRTKAGIIVGLFLIIFFVIKEFYSSKSKKIKMFYIIVIMLTIIFVIYTIISLVEQLTYFNEIYDYDSLYSLIVSNRNYQIEYAKQYITSTYSDRQLSIIRFFGAGCAGINGMLMERKKNGLSIEQDLWGIKLYLGNIALIIVILLILLAISQLVKIRKMKKDSILFQSLLQAFSIGIIHSILAGHVFYEALSNMLLGILMAVINFIYIKNDKNILL